jgi:sorting nexin-3/12
MQRIEPRQIDPTPTANYGQEGQESSQNRPGSGNLPTGFASTGRDAHTQSFEEIYGVPENFLEIEVRSSSPVLGQFAIPGAHALM